MRRNSIAKELACLALLAIAAFVVNGYHLGTEDGAIYAPAIKKVADPALYPVNAQFFSHHASLSLFPNLIGGAASLLVIPIEWAMLLAYGLSLFLLMLAAHQLACICFPNERARWAAVALLAGVLSVPVCGTALILVDPYLTARSLSTPTTLLAIGCLVAGRRSSAVAWLAVTAVIHPQMCIYGVAFAVIWECVRYARQRNHRIPAVPAIAAALLLPFSFEWQPAHGAYREILDSRSYFLISRWRWFEWLGVILPLLILWKLSRMDRLRVNRNFAPLCSTLVIFGIISTAAALLLASSPDFEYFARLQPMRSFHPIYVVFFVILGGLLGDYVLRRQIWRWAALFTALAACMLTVQAATFPSSPHIEWPGVPYRNGLLAAFQWIRDNTPKDAYFAIDPDYLAMPGVDMHGFRAIAERGVLADRLKDSGAASVFPELSDVWKDQVSAQNGWKSFQEPDFRNLQARFHVQWVMLEISRPLTYECPYQNSVAKVCRLPRETR